MRLADADALRRFVMGDRSAAEQVIEVEHLELEYKPETLQAVARLVEAMRGLGLSTSLAAEGMVTFAHVVAGAGDTLRELEARRFRPQVARRAALEADVELRRARRSAGIGFAGMVDAKMRGGEVEELDGVKWEPWMTDPRDPRHDAFLPLIEPPGAL